MDRTELMKNIVATLDSKKATNIKSLEITELSSVADYFVIATGTSGTHIRALSDEVQDALTKQGVEPRNVEGKSTGWILLDYNTVVVHLFTPDQRETYSLEHLWGDAKEFDISEIITED
ncbi:MAG: ribosome silencing factor [Clostridia bacterium]|nr:ribosome silencing factor [Clostridia bacterium]